MCQEIHLSDVRLALLDYCEEHDDGDAHLQPNDLLTQFDHPLDDGIVHAFDHKLRSHRLASQGDNGPAEMHRALFANIARATG